VVDTHEAILDLFLYDMKLGTAIAARIPIMATTIINSISVKPFSFLILTFDNIAATSFYLNMLVKKLFHLLRPTSPPSLLIFVFSLIVLR